jgi:hypothetical protein
MTTKALIAKKSTVSDWREYRRKPAKREGAQFLGTRDIEAGGILERMKSMQLLHLLGYHLKVLVSSETLMYIEYSAVRITYEIFSDYTC